MIPLSHSPEHQCITTVPAKDPVPVCYRRNNFLSQTSVTAIKRYLGPSAISPIDWFPVPIILFQMKTAHKCTRHPSLKVQGYSFWRIWACRKQRHATVISCTATILVHCFALVHHLLMNDYQVALLYPSTSQKFS